MGNNQRQNYNVHGQSYNIRNKPQKRRNTIPFGKIFLLIIIAILGVTYYPDIIKRVNSAKHELQGMEVVAEMRTQFRNVGQYYFRVGYDNDGTPEDYFWKATGAPVRPFWARCFKLEVIDSQSPYIFIQKSNINLELEENKVCASVYNEPQIIIWLRGSKEEGVGRIPISENAK